MKGKGDTRNDGKGYNVGTVSSGRLIALMTNGFSLVFELRRHVPVALLALLLAACASTSESPAETAPEASAATEEEQLRRQQAAEAAARARRIAEAERQRQEELQRQAELAGQRAEAEREAAEARQRAAERERLAQEQLALERERQEQERLAAIAAEREEKLARIEALETRINELQAQVVAGDAQNDALREAVLVSEQLLALLTEEQARYEEDNLDAAGNLIDPPATDAIAELEARRNGLLEQINAC